MVGLIKFSRERKMSKVHFARKIMTFINSQEGARGPDRSLGPDPGYAFQGVFDSVRSGVKAAPLPATLRYMFFLGKPLQLRSATLFFLDKPLPAPLRYTVFRANFEPWQGCHRKYALALFSACREECNLDVRYRD